MSKIDMKVDAQQDENQLEYDEIYGESVEEIAKSKGCVVEYPLDNQIQIDIDSDEAYKRFDWTLNMLTNANVTKLTKPLVDAEIIDERPSKSGLPHRHIIIDLAEGTKLTEEQRIILQLALGSDPLREKMNALRYLLGVSKPTRLFRPK